MPLTTTQVHVCCKVTFVMQRPKAPVILLLKMCGHIFSNTQTKTTAHENYIPEISIFIYILLTFYFFFAFSFSAFLFVYSSLRVKGSCNVSLEWRQADGTWKKAESVRGSKFRAKRR